MTEVFECCECLEVMGEDELDENGMCDECRKVDCKDCGGTGLGDGDGDCETCGGDGRI